MRFLVGPLLIVLSLVAALSLMSIYPVVRSGQYLASVPSPEREQRTSRTLTFIHQWSDHADAALEDDYTPEEFSHLIDVRDAFQWVLRIFFVLLVTCGLLFMIRWPRKLPGMLRSGQGIVLLVAIFGLTSFTKWFDRIHALFFPAGSWSFPENSVLISLFPETFWMIWIGGVFVCTLALLELIIMLLRLTKKSPQ